MSLTEIMHALNRIAWGPGLLMLLLGTGVFLSFRLNFFQFRKFGYAMKNTAGKMLHKQKAGEGEVTPFQAVATALAATVGTGNIAGVTGAIAVGGPGAVFWMWVSGLFGMVTKYAEIVLAVQYRERNEKGDYVGGPMYYIKNGLGKSWGWLAVVFSVLGAITAFGTGNMTQINTIAGAVNTAIDAFGGHTGAHTAAFLGQQVPVTSIVIGVLVAAVVALVLFGGIKRIGSVTEKTGALHGVRLYRLLPLCGAGKLQSDGQYFQHDVQGGFFRPLRAGRRGGHLHHEDYLHGHWQRRLFQ